MLYSSQRALPSPHLNEVEAGRRIGAKRGFRMEALSIPHLLIILLIVLIFFGGRRIPDVMKGLGEGIRSFKDGMRGDQQGHANPPVNPPPVTPTEEKK